MIGSTDEEGKKAVSKVKNMDDVLNKRNINALAQSGKDQNNRVQKLEEEVVQLKGLVTQLMLEIKEVKAQTHIQRVVGPTAS